MAVFGYVSKQLFHQGEDELLDLIGARRAQMNMRPKTADFLVFQMCELRKILSRHKARIKLGPKLERLALGFYFTDISTFEAALMSSSHP